MTHNNNDRILFLDVLRIVAVFAVVLIHSTYPYGEKFDQSKIYDWWSANIYNAMSRWSVPIMVMISGALLLNPQKNESIPIFFKKRFNRILIPTLFWSIFYMFWNGINKDADLQVSTILLNLITGQVNYHLWFLYLIISLYILTPVLRIFIKNAEKIHIEYFIIIWLVSIFSTYIRVRYDIGIGVDIGFFTGFIGYYILGYYLSIIDFEEKYRYKYLIYLLSFLGALITIFGTYILIREKNLLDQSYYDYISPNIMAMTTGLFIFFKSIDRKISKITDSLKINDFIMKTGMLGFGIYLVHAMILSVIGENLKLISLFGPIIGIPLLASVTMLISYFLVRIIDKIPILKYIV